jgi:hypothetical protein
MRQDTGPQQGPNKPPTGPPKPHLHKRPPPHSGGRPCDHLLQPQQRPAQRSAVHHVLREGKHVFTAATNATQQTLSNNTHAAERRERVDEWDAMLHSKALQAQHVLTKGRDAVVWRAGQGKVRPLLNVSQLCTCSANKCTQHPCFKSCFNHAAAQTHNALQVCGIHITLHE